MSLQHLSQYNKQSRHIFITDSVASAACGRWVPQPPIPEVTMHRIYAPNERRRWLFQYIGYRNQELLLPHRLYFHISMFKALTLLQKPRWKNVIESTSDYNESRTSKTKRIPTVINTDLLLSTFTLPDTKISGLGGGFIYGECRVIDKEWMKSLSFDIFLKFIARVLISINV